MPSDNSWSRVDQALAAPEASMPARFPWSEVPDSDDFREALAAPIAPEPSPVARAENPELERRVLALERLLRALLAHLAEAQPDLLARLEDAFSASLLNARADDDKGIDTCAAALLHSALRPGGMPGGGMPGGGMAGGGMAAEAPPAVAKPCGPAVETPVGNRDTDQLSFRPPPVRFRKVGGIWRVTKDRPA